MSLWIKINDRLPENNQRVLAFIPKNKVFLPGKQLDFEIREVVILHFRENFYAEDDDKKRSMEFIFGLEKEIAITSFKT